MAKDLGISLPSSRAPKGPGKKSGNTNVPESGTLAALNFKVTPEFKKEFKVWAITHQKTQRAMLEEAFELLKKQYQ